MWIRRRAGLGRLAGALALLLASTAGAATFTVDDAADLGDLTGADGVCLSAAGTCTLRAAILQARLDADNDVIVLPAGRFAVEIAGYSDDACMSGDFDVEADLQITGAGAGATIVDARGMDRAFHVLGGATLWLSDLAVEGGSSPGFANGGGILLAPGSSLHATDCTFARNVSRGFGAAVMSEAGSSLLLDGCRFEANDGAEAVDAGLVFAPISIVRFCDFVGNRRGALRGGMVNVLGCTFEDNAPYGALTVGRGGALVVRHSTFARNRRAEGGAILVEVGAEASIEDSTFDDNDATNGGAIASYGHDVTIERVTIRGCTAEEGGAVSIDAGSAPIPPNVLRIVDSTLHDNVASRSGGALHFFTVDGAATLVVRSSTITGNVARVSGGGLNVDAWSRGRVVVVGSTIAENECAVGSEIAVASTAAQVSLERSIVAGAEGSSGCSGSIVSGGDNLFSSAAPCVVLRPSDLVGVDPLLGSLQDEGGPTLTRAPRRGSPAIDAVSSACVDEDGDALPTDQRGLPRSFDGDGDGRVACDVGAVEFQGCGTDSDGDGLGDACDCAPADGGVVDAPLEADVRVAKDPTTADAVVSWPDPRPLFGTATTSDVASDSIGRLRSSRRADAGCVAQAIDGPWTDARAVTDVGWYYLVRSSNSCGPAAGTGWGTDSLGRERPACP